MRSPITINAFEFQSRIDKKLHELQNRKNDSRSGNVKSKEHHKVMSHLKWNTVKRNMEKFQKIQKLENNNIKMVKPLMTKGDLMATIDRIMLLQKSLIILSRNIGNYRRLQMGGIFFQCSLSIIFNAYNLVVFLLKMANGSGGVPLTLSTLLFFYGYYIFCSLVDIIISVIVYHGVYEMIRQTATKMDELSMYILDTTINLRISQLSDYVYNNLKITSLFGLFNIDGSLVTSTISGTITYIIILIQYSEDGEIFNIPEHLNMNATKN